MENAVQLDLDGDEAILLFEYLHKAVDKQKAKTAERIVLDNLMCKLESVLVLPFAPDHEVRVSEARERIAIKWGLE